MSVIKYLSENLGLPRDHLRKYIRTCPHRYKVYTIPKRKEGRRTIAQPARALKHLQRLVLERLLSDMPVHEAAVAYRKNIGIKHNAELHKANSYLLKLDFHDFFPSIKPQDLISHIEKYNVIDLVEDDIDALSRLFFYSKHRGNELQLSIGAPSSPMISNSIMYDFDAQLSTHCNGNNVVYTRYADDITLSTNTKGELYNYPDIINQLLEKLDYPTLRLNINKTVFASKKVNRHVTGLVITNDEEISLGRDKKRKIRTMIFRYKNGQLDDDEVHYLRGYLSFCNDVEPSFIHRLENKYGKEVLESLKAH